MALVATIRKSSADSEASTAADASYEALNSRVLSIVATPQSRRVKLSSSHMSRMGLCSALQRCGASALPAAAVAAPVTVAPAAPAAAAVHETCIQGGPGRGASDSQPLQALRSNAEAAMTEMEANFDTGIFDFLAPAPAAEVGSATKAGGRDLLDTLLEKRSRGAIEDVEGGRWATHFWDTRSSSRTPQSTP
ncbi:unnamed protein product [Symbiodinium sp. CCMP2592]|nr:unnamed protein product [Symbiodinium sp. CCMP2592]